jgi:hypothetical protein
MSVICQTASGFARLFAAPLALRSPRGLVESLAALGLVATLRLRAQRFLEALRGTQRERKGVGGPGEPPEIDLAAYSYCDDPFLWTLIMWH